MHFQSTENSNTSFDILMTCIYYKKRNYFEKFIIITICIPRAVSNVGRISEIIPRVNSPASATFRMCFLGAARDGIEEPGLPGRVCCERSQMNYFTSQDTSRYFESDYGEQGTRESYNYSRLKDDADILGRGLPRKLSSTARQQSRERRPRLLSLQMPRRPTIGVV